MGWSFNQRKAVAQMVEQRSRIFGRWFKPSQSLAGGSRTIPLDRIIERDRLAHLTELSPPSYLSLSERLKYWATYNPELPGLLIMDLIEASRQLHANIGHKRDDNPFLSNPVVWLERLFDANYTADWNEKTKTIIADALLDLMRKLKDKEVNVST